MMCHYNLIAPFKIWIFSSSILKCLVIAFSEFILVQVYLASWICKFMIFIKFGEFLAVLQIFVLHQFLFISFWSSHKKNIRLFDIVSQGLASLIFFSLKIIFYLLFRLDNICWSIKFMVSFLILHSAFLSPRTGFCCFIFIFQPYNFLLVLFKLIISVLKTCFSIHLRSVCPVSWSVVLIAGLKSLIILSE